MTKARASLICPIDGTEVRNRHGASTVNLDDQAIRRLKSCQQGHKFQSVEVLLEGKTTLSSIILGLRANGNSSQ